MRRTLTLVFAFVFLGWMPVWAQAPPTANDVDINQVLSKGINFDHIFLPYNGNHPLTEEQWNSIRKNLRESEFKQVAALGFTHVRLNLGLDFLRDPQTPDSLNPRGLALLDQAVEMAKRNGLGVVLDMHQTPAPDIFHDPKELESYITLWKNLAAHYSRQPLSVLFEVINEPAIPELTKSDPPQWDIRHWRAGVQVLTDIIRQEDPNHYLVQGDIQHWRAILKSLIEAVRKEDPDRYIVVTGGGWGGAETLIQMGSLGFPRLIYDFHYYEPFMFTHQGAYWVDKSISTLKGIHYPVSESEVVAAWVAAKKAGFQEWPFKSYPHGFDSDNTRQNLEPLFSFAKKENIQLYCGEFGVLKAGPPPEDRVRWLRDVTDLFRENGVGWANWAYHASFDMADQNGNPDRQEVEALGLTGEK